LVVAVSLSLVLDLAFWTPMTLMLSCVVATVDGAAANMNLCYLDLEDC
jgi:hypothetical protein